MTVSSGIVCWIFSTISDKNSLFNISRRLSDIRGFLVVVGLLWQYLWHLCPILYLCRSYTLRGVGVFRRCVTYLLLIHYSQLCGKNFDICLLQLGLLYGVDPPLGESCNCLSGVQLIFLELRKVHLIDRSWMGLFSSLVFSLFANYLSFALNVFQVVKYFCYKFLISNGFVFEILLLKSPLILFIFSSWYAA